MTPQRTFAIVVGIEKYAAGSSWDLDGPSHDAVRFCHWMRECGVPAEQIALHISPLTKNENLQLPKDVVARDAVSTSIERLIRDELRNRAESLLWVFWGGHGIARANGERRLFFSDARIDDPKNLSVSELLIFLRSQVVQPAAFERQIISIDACANYVERLGWKASLPTTTFSISLPEPRRKQFVHFATRPGERALNVQQSGVFSGELLKELAKRSAVVWPPDLDAITAAVAERFAVLRAQGHVHQTPAFLNYTNWSNDEKTYASIPQVAAVAGTQSSIQPLTNPQVNQLARALLNCPTFGDIHGRKTIVRQLRSEIYFTTAYSEIPLIHATNLIRTCLSFQGGMPEFLEAIRNFDGATVEFEAVEKLVERMLPDSDLR